MKIIFNDASEISVQQVKSRGDYLDIITLEQPEKLYEYFSNPDKTRLITVEERGQRTVYEGYTQFYRTETYVGGIYGVVVYKPDKTPEVQSEIQQAAVVVAQIQAQSLTDEQALTVKSIYPAWSPDNVQYAVDFKVLHEDTLYKCISAHTSQSDWASGAAPSLWTAIESGEHAGTQEDPIPVPETVTTAGMEYEKGKYYSEGGKVYLMDREGMEDGEKITLYFAPSALVGQYFSVAE